jgi:hypothetical protein
MARGGSRAVVAEKFKVSQWAARRHWVNHVSEPVKAAQVLKVLAPGQDLEKLLDDENMGLLEHLQRIRASLFEAFDAACEAGDRNGIGQLAGRLPDNLKIAALKSGELDKHRPGNITNILLAPVYLDLRSQLLAALRQYPEAARAVAEAFRRIEAPMLEGRAIEARHAF